MLCSIACEKFTEFYGKRFWVMEQNKIILYQGDEIIRLAVKSADVDLCLTQDKIINSKKMYEIPEFFTLFLYI